MAQKSTPIITHTKILALAIRCLESDLDELKERYKGKPGAEEFLQIHIDQYTPELVALKEMYRIETGTDYV